MAQLVLNNVDEELADRLEARAATHGVTPGEEALQILNSALAGGEALRILDDALEDGDELPHFTGEENIKFSDFLRSMPNVGRDEDFARLPGNIRDVEL